MLISRSGEAVKLPIAHGRTAQGRSQWLSRPAEGVGSEGNVVPIDHWNHRFSVAASLLHLEDRQVTVECFRMKVQVACFAIPIRTVTSGGLAEGFHVFKHEGPCRMLHHPLVQVVADGVAARRILSVAAGKLFWAIEAFTASPIVRAIDWATGDERSGFVIDVAPTASAFPDAPVRLRMPGPAAARAIERRGRFFGTAHPFEPVEAVRLTR